MSKSPVRFEIGLIRQHAYCMYFPNTKHIEVVKLSHTHICSELYRNNVVTYPHSDCIYCDIYPKPNVVSLEHANLVGIPTWEFRWGGRSSTPLMKFRAARQHALGGIINCSLLVLLRYGTNSTTTTSRLRE